MKNAGVVLLLVVAGCIDFDAKLVACDAGLGVCAHQAVDGGDVDAGDRGDGGAADASVACPGSSFQGFCWVNPTPAGDDWLAVAGSRDDYWLGGAAGLVLRWHQGRWEDHRLLDGLRSSDLGFGAVASLALFDGGVVAVGHALWPHVFQDGSWKVPLASTDYIWLSSVAVDEAGFLAVGRGVTGAKTVGGRFDAPVVVDVAKIDELQRVLAGPGHRGFVMTGVRGSTALFVKEDGGLVELSGNNPLGLGALWSEGARAWCGGDAVTAVYDFATGQFDAGVPGPAIVIAAGSSFAGQLVLLGNHDVFAEGPSSAGLTGGLVPVEVTDVDHQMIGNTAVISDESGWAVAVGPNGSRFRRTSGHWVYEGALFKADITDALAIDGGVLFYGNSGLIGTVYADSLQPVFTTPNSSLAAVNAVWEGGGARWLSRGGELCRVVSETGGCTRRATPTGAPLSLLVGRSEANLWALGAKGGLAHLQSDGGWAAVSHDGGAADFVAAANVGAAVAAFSVGAGSSVMRLLRADGSTEVTNTSLKLEVTAASVAPSGLLWLGGDRDDGANLRLLKVNPDGSVTEQRYTSDSFVVGDVVGLAAVSDSEAWLVDSNASLWHVQGEGWSRVEMGTRAKPNALVLSTGPDGQRSLWLVGAFGMILHHAL